MFRNTQEKSSIKFSWKVLLVSGCALLSLMAIVILMNPWTWENIEKLRHYMHRDMNAEVYYYYFCKIRTLFSLAVFAALYLIAAALTARFVPLSKRLKILSVPADEKFFGFPGGSLIFIFSLGIFLRLENYMFHTFWCDTLSLADALMQTPFRSLFTAPLPNMQSAPPGFLLAAKILGETFGYRELVLGLPSLAAGVASLFCFYRLMKSHFQAGVVLVMLFLFAFNPAQIFYSGEFKQYSCDVFFSILMLDLGLKLLRDHSRGLVIRAALAGIAAVLFSHASFFVIPPLGAMLFFYSLSSREKSYEIRMVILNLVWALVLLGDSIYTLHVMPKGMYVYHNSFFAPVPRDRESFLWYWKLFQNLFCHLHGLSFPVFLLNIVPFTVILTGMVQLWKKCRWTFLGAVFPLVLLFISSLLKYYPIESHDNAIYSRLILFTTPIIYFIFAAGLEWLYSGRKKLFYGIAIFSVGTAFVLFLKTFTVRWNVKPLYRQLTSGIASGDRLYASMSGICFIHIFSDAAKSLPCPRHFSIIDDHQKIVWHEGDADAFFPVRGRYWLFLSFVSNGEMLKEHLEKIGKVQVWSEAGGILFRLDKTR